MRYFCFFFWPSIAFHSKNADAGTRQRLLLNGPRNIGFVYASSDRALNGVLIAFGSFAQNGTIPHLRIDATRLPSCSRITGFVVVGRTSAFCANSRSPGSMRYREPRFAGVSLSS